MESFDDEYVREIVLDKCRDKFINDFDFGDIRRDLANASVLPLTDLDKIMRSKPGAEQIDNLFFRLVIRGDDAYNKFKYQLHAKYGWLLRAIEVAEAEVQNERDMNNLLLPYKGKVIELIKELPRFVDYNIHRCELVNEIFVSG